MCGSSAVGILLSGNGFDGTAGLKTIRETGGSTIVQHPETAEFRSMPQNAFEADTADFVLLPHAIPAKLLEIYSSYKVSHGYDGEDIIPEDDMIRKISDLIFHKSGNDFGQYKIPTIRRRTARRMVLTQRETLTAYYNFLRIDEAEQADGRSQGYKSSDLCFRYFC